jgi:hypothetical protein
MTSPPSKNAGSTTKPLHSMKLSKPTNKYRLSYIISSVIMGDQRVKDSVDVRCAERLGEYFLRRG